MDIEGAGALLPAKKDPPERAGQTACEQGHSLSLLIIPNGGILHAGVCALIQEVFALKLLIRLPKQKKARQTASRNLGISQSQIHITCHLVIEPS